MKDKMEYIMPLKTVILNQIKLVIEKTLEYYNDKKSTDPSHIKCGFYDIAHDLEFILCNIDIIKFEDSEYINLIKQWEDNQNND